MQRNTPKGAKHSFWLKLVKISSDSDYVTQVQNENQQLKNLQPLPYLDQRALSSINFPSLPRRSSTKRRHICSTFVK